MPINSTHPSYDLYSPRWSRCSDCFDGEDAVKAAGTTYLPALGPTDTLEREQDYKAYKHRAEFVNFLGPTVRGITGLVFRREPVVKVSARLTELAGADLTLTGLTFREWLRHAAVELLKTGRLGTFVDWNEKLNRPYVTNYAAADIVNWGAGWWVLRECYLRAKPEDPFKQEEVYRYRHLYLGAGGAYTVDVYELAPDKKDDFVKVSSKIMKFRGRALNVIPFTVIGALGTTEPCEPPMLDLVNVNLSHYRTSADLEHGRHFTALPTPYVTGLDPDDEKNKTLRIGSQAAWIIPNENSEVGMLEFTGAGLASLKDAKEEKAREAAMLGALMLMEPQKQAETAETARIHASGKTASLNDVCTALEAHAETVLGLLGLYLGEALDEEREVTLNREFVAVRLSAQELTALGTLLAQHAISYETFFWNLQNGLVVPPDRKLEEEVKAIADEEAPSGAPPVPGPTVTAPAADAPPDGGDDQPGSQANPADAGAAREAGDA